MQKSRLLSSRRGLLFLLFFFFISSAASYSYASYNILLLYNRENPDSVTTKNFDNNIILDTGILVRIVPDEIILIKKPSDELKVSADDCSVTLSAFLKKCKFIPARISQESSYTFGLEKQEGHLIIDRENLSGNVFTNIPAKARLFIRSAE